MGKPNTYLNEEEDGDIFHAEDFDSGADPEPRKREPKAPHRHAARQRLDSRKEELWLKQQLTDWDDDFDSADLRN